MSSPEASFVLPSLDLRTFAAQPAKLAHALGAAFERYGFVSVVGHGIGPELTAPVYAAMARFFALPDEVKRRYHLKGAAGARGYTPFGVEKARDQTLPDLKEFWHVGREVPPDNPYGLPCNVWPSEVPELKPLALRLWVALEALGRELLTHVAVYLDLPKRFFDDVIDHGNSILRPLHYPALAPGVAGVRSAAHEDINLITLLVSSGEPGLEIKLREGAFLPVEVAADAVVVNVGDMLQRLTNHTLRSTTHRVVNPGPPWDARSRYSIPFFLHPNSEFVIRSLPGCVTADNPDRYPQPICADDYLKQRLREIGLL